MLDSIRQKQSIQQIGALFLLIVAAVLLSIGEGSSKGSTSGDPEQILFYGIIPVLVASLLSGLASSLCQWASQVEQNGNQADFIIRYTVFHIQTVLQFSFLLIFTNYRSRNTLHI